MESEVLQSDCIAKNFYVQLITNFYVVIYL
jgi:hypothetical protein